MGVLRNDFGRTVIGNLVLYLGLPSAFINFMVWALNLCAATAIAFDGVVPTNLFVGHQHDWINWILLPTHLLIWTGLNSLLIVATIVLICAIVTILELAHFKWVEKEFTPW